MNERTVQLLTAAGWFGLAGLLCHVGTVFGHPVRGIVVAVLLIIPAIYNVALATCRSSSEEVPDDFRTIDELVEEYRKDPVRAAALEEARKSLPAPMPLPEPPK